MVTIQAVAKATLGFLGTIQGFRGHWSVFGEEGTGLWVV